MDEASAVDVERMRPATNPTNTGVTAPELFHDFDGELVDAIVIHGRPRTAV